MKKTISTLLFILSLFIFISNNAFAKSADENEIIELEGKGTKRNPYLISTEADLFYFAKLVNNGNSFEGKYLQQTDDLDLENKPWTPIGLFDSDNLFCGTYDGAGHIIDNLYVNYGGNNAFFGVLCGTVMNLGLNSGSIEGVCTGSITSHAGTDSAIIINCFNKASVKGGRVGGIADNFGASIVNCWTSCELEALDPEQIGGIVSYDNGITINCFSFEAEGRSAVCLPGSTMMSAPEDSLQTIVDTLNEGLYIASNEIGISYKDLYYWEISEDGDEIVFSNEKGHFSFNYLSEFFSVHKEIPLTFWSILLIIIGLMIICGPRKLLASIREFQISEISPTGLFLFISLICTGLFIINIVASNGALLDHWFFFDTRDSGMDFFHSLEYVNNKQPYETFNVLYPPFTNLLFLGFLSLIPDKLTSQWTSDFTESVGLRGTDLDLRTHQSTLFAYLLFLLICVVFIIELVQYLLREKSELQRRLVSICVLFSYGMLWAIERGNVILLAWCFTLSFLMFYQSENPKVRAFACICLAFAAGIKLYPAVFGIVLINKKYIKSAIKTALLGVLIIVLACFAFQDGLGGLVKWINVVISFVIQGSGTSPIGNSFNNILSSFNHLLSSLLPISIPEGSFGIISYVAIFLLLIMSIFYRVQWKKILAVTLAIIFFSTQIDYIYMFFSIPLLFLLRDEKKVHSKNVLYIIGLTLLTANVPFFYTKNISYPRNTMVQIIMSFFFLDMSVHFVIALTKFIKQKRSRN